MSEDLLDPFQEVDDLANNLEGYNAFQHQFSILGSPIHTEYNDDDDEEEEEEQDDTINQRSFQHYEHKSSTAQVKGLIWPYIRPILERILMKVTYILFFAFFFSKEIVYALCALADMACFTLIINSGLFVLKLFGFYKDTSYINPRRMLSEEDTDHPKYRVPFLLVAGIIYGSVVLSWLYPHTLSWPTHLLSSRSYQLESNQNVELFRDAIISVLPSWVPLDAESGRIDAQELLHTLDDRYVMQQAQVPDFALATLGSRVLVQYTSPTFDTRKKGWRSSVYQWLHPQVHFSPVMALLPDTHPGQCWPMAGKYGSLGVRLSQSVSANAVSIDHADHQLVTDLSSAPKDFEVWGLTRQKRTAKWKDPWDPAASLAGDAVYLGKFKYNIDGNAMQTFKIEPASPPLKDIVFRFLTNWDKDEYTCIYRVRVHGDTV